MNFADLVKNHHLKDLQIALDTVEPVTKSYKIYNTF